MSAKNEWLTIITPETDAPDYVSFSLLCTATEEGPGDWKGDGSQWEFDHTTAQPDITAHELAQIISIRLSLPDGMTGRLKTENVLRHFRHVPAPVTEET